MDDLAARPVTDRREQPRVERIRVELRRRDERPVPDADRGHEKRDRDSEREPPNVGVDAACAHDGVRPKRRNDAPSWRLGGTSGAKTGPEERPSSRTHVTSDRVRYPP